MKLCLIGSTRFRDKFIEVNKDLTLKGHVVYTVAFYKEPTEVSAREKEVLDLVHLRKIAESDGVVLITDETGYVGDSTRRELMWAEMLEKPIHLDPNEIEGIIQDPAARVKELLAFRSGVTGTGLGAILGAGLGPNSNFMDGEDLPEGTGYQEDAEREAQG